MKQYFIAPILAVLFLLVINSCQKQTDNDPAPVIPKSTKDSVPVAKAPADTTISLPVNSVTLTGSGTDATGHIIGYLWTQVSGPSEATIVNESSAIASFKGLIAGTYKFQFAVIDDNGLTGLASVSVIVKPATMVTLTLQPANNPGESNVGIWNGGDFSNHTSIEEPLAAWTKDSFPVVIRNLLKFDLSSIPANATIVSANLQLYSDTIPQNGDLIHANYGTDNSVLIQQVATNWDVTSLTWFNQPAGLTANQVTIPSTTQPFLNVNVDVKGLVAPMVSSGANYGFKLQLKNEVEYTSRIFCSSYYSDATRHPKLVVQYIKN
ncbi:DNRLRE domain-containing protein [Mucilaginibacter sp.]|uniref:DNRLRE domain-containing protein n=1 Tax=Mucilaginibacter sp. TaxID=1882438 RepID=UPI00284B3CED|nr:DNRLRE domain-containing protein [Mucilaginibacter sp.]MDR3693520.1 DNRLRE domain-containing protein [Mucilaginibacter sp.]